MIGLVVALLLACDDDALAQGASPAAPVLTSTVLDSTGARVPNATVVVQYESAGLPLVFTAGFDGTFTTLPLANGGYTLSVTVAGFVL